MSPLSAQALRLINEYPEHIPMGLPLQPAVIPDDPDDKPDEEYTL